MSTLEVDKIIPQSGTATQVGENGDTINVPSGATLNINSGATIANNGTATGFDTDTNDKVKVSANDTTAGFLNGKLVAGTNISLTEGSDGGNETLTAALTGTIATAQIADDAVTLAKMAPGTDGNIISYDASGNPVAVATGSAGQVLTSAGAGAPPTFAAAGGITNVDRWAMSNQNYSNGDTMTTGWSRVTTLNGMPYGTGLTQSSGIFSFPNTGLYKIDIMSYVYNGNNTHTYVGIAMKGTNDAFSSNIQNLGVSYNQIAIAQGHGNIAEHTLYKIDNTSNNKFKLMVEANTGTPGFYQTYITFMRLGDG